MLLKLLQLIESYVYRKQAWGMAPSGTLNNEKGLNIIHVSIHIAVDNMCCISRIFLSLTESRSDACECSYAPDIFMCIDHACESICISLI